MRALTWVTGTWSDLRYAARGLARAPIYTTVSILTLALGIGASTAAYSVVGSILLKSLPYAHAEQLVAAWSATPASASDPISFPDFEDYRAQNTVFSGMAFIVGDQMTLRDRGGGVGILSGMVSEDYFPVLGVRPIVGRVLQAADFRPGAQPAAVMSYRFWVSHFGAAPDVVGRTLTLSTGSVTVVGVLGPDQGYPDWGPNRTSELFVPLLDMPYELRKVQNRSMRADSRVIARLRSGVTARMAERQLGLIASRLAAAYPATDSGRGVHLEPLRQVVVGNIAAELTVLLAAVSLVFLLACADVANLALVRATARAREIAVRIAIGAGRRRVTSFVLWESVLLIAGSTVLGLVLAVGAVRAIIAAAPGGIPRIDAIAIDGRAIVGMFITAGVAAAACATAPLAVTGGSAVASILKTGGHAPGVGRRGMRLRTAVLNAQLAIATTLVVGAGLLVRTLVRMSAIDPGYDASHLIAWDSSYPRKTDSAVARAAFYQRELTAVGAVPGVASSGLVYLGLETPVGADGARPDTSQASVGLAGATPGLFAAMRIPLLQGRDFAGTDMTRDASVAVISKLVADRYWPGRDPLGRRLTVVNVSTADPQLGKPVEATVIGVVGEIKRYSVAQAEPTPLVYLPLGRLVVTHTLLAVRTSGPPASVVNTLRRILGNLDPDLQVSDLGVYHETVGTAGQHFTSSLLNAFSIVALALAALGLYGVMSYVVRTRIGEVGIRMALGARPSDITRLFVGQAVATVIVGLGAGIAGGVLLGRTMRSMLYGVGPVDLMTFAAVIAVLAAVTLVASYVPARHGSRIDPVEALRTE